MKCFKCDSDNENKAKFCSNCGSKQEQSADESGNVFKIISKDVHSIKTWSNMFKAPPNENEWGVKNIIKAIYFIILFFLLILFGRYFYFGYGFFWINNFIQAPLSSFHGKGDFYFSILIYLIIYSGIIYFIIFLWKKIKKGKNKKFYVLILISVITIFGYLLINDRNRVKHQCYYNRTGELDNYIDISCCLESHGIRNDLLSEKVRDSIDLDCPAPSLF